jgi:hypothetical protein
MCISIVVTDIMIVKSVY